MGGVLLNGWDWAAIVAFFAMLIGVSMCAASTSTNSANMFTEFIRNSGLSENWKWWAFLLTGMLTVFVYSKLWVRSGAKRASFQNRIRANGHDIAWSLLAMTVACTCVYAMMFASGYWIYGRTPIAVTMTVIAVVSGAALVPVLRRLNRKGVA